MMPKKINKPSLSSKIKEATRKTDNAPHIIVKALAGTGKTTTLVEGAGPALGQALSKLVPSPQQKAVWDAMWLSAGHITTACFCAFNRSIADELKTRVPAGCDAMTLHSMGYKAVRNTFGNLKRPDGRRVENIISEITSTDIWELRRHHTELLKGTAKLVSLCKMNLVESSATDYALDDLCSHYEIELNGNRRKVFDLVPKILDRCLDVVEDGYIDFDDMVWLPVVLDLSVTVYDLLMVDEAQDLNRCQQALARKASRRLVLCGDPNQAIYGFAGADSESMNRMEQELMDSDRGCIVLPLTETRRCGKAIVAEAQKIVPDFTAHESNCEGAISGAPYKALGRNGAAGWHELTSDGDMVLCRVNAPLVSQCFAFLKQGRKANIRGRDIGTGLISTINRMKANDIGELVQKLSDWHQRESQKEAKKRNPNEARLIALQDRYDCLECFIEDAETITDVIAKIEAIFTDKDQTGIQLSSIHKAKGLEADRVFLLQPEGATMPHPMARSKWQREQESNLLYVALTRAIRELVFVT